MPLHDYTAPCGHAIIDEHFSGLAPLALADPCPVCGITHIFEKSWSSRTRQLHSIHTRERAVVYTNPATGETVYPGQNNLDMPVRYKRQGFERRELNSLREIEKFEKEAGVRSEVAWFDRGTGRGHEDGQDPIGTVPKEVYDMVRKGIIG